MKAVFDPKQKFNGSRPMTASQRKAEVETPHCLGSGLAAEFDRMTQIVSDVFSMIKQLLCNSGVLEWVEHELQVLTYNWAS